MLVSKQKKPPGKGGFGWDFGGNEKARAARAGGL
jgi:hypothetical protein